jgi:hypothetical protein
MRLFKGKVEKTVAEQLTLLGEPNAGSAIEIQSVYFQCNNPNAYVLLFDADGDQVLYPMPGQVDPKPILLDSPITVKAPLYYVDTRGENGLIVFGKVIPLDSRVPSSFTQLNTK